MATDEERLLVRIEASLRGFERQMAKASGTADKAATRIERRFKDVNRNLHASSLAMARGLLGPIAALASAREIGRAADSFTRIQNSLRIAGLEGEEAADTLQRLFDIAQKNGTPIESLAELYGRVAAAQKELNTTTGEMLTLTGAVSNSLKVSGISAEQASGALLQLGQALTGGKIQAEEYNSLIDGLRPLLQAAANGMVEAGGSVAKLTQLVKAGKVSSEAFYRAILAGSGSLQDLSDKADSTIGQAFTRLRNQMTLSIGKLDKTTLASTNLATGIDGVADALADMIDWLIRAEPALDRAGNKIAQTFQYITRQARMAGRDLGTQSLGENAGFTDPIDNMIQDVFDTIDETDSVITALGGSNERLEAALRKRAALMGGDLIAGGSGTPPLPRARPEPITLEKYAVPGDSKGSKKSPAERFDEDLARIRERTQALLVETAAIGKSTYERTKELEVLGLTNEARRAGVEITPQLVAAIDLEAEAYARAAAEAETMQQRYAEMQELQQFFGDQVMSVFSDIISGTGSVEESFKRIASAIAEAALQAAILGQGPLAGLFGTSSPSGGVGGLIGALFGRASGGPVNAGQTYMVGERGRELFVPTSAGRIVSNDNLGGGASVQIVDQRGKGEPVEVERSRGPDGREVIRAMIRDELPKMAQSGRFRQIGLGVQPGRR